MINAYKYAMKGVDTEKSYPYEGGKVKLFHITLINTQCICTLSSYLQFISRQQLDRLL